LGLDELRRKIFRLIVNLATLQHNGTR